MQTMNTNAESRNPVRIREAPEATKAIRDGMRIAYLIRGKDGRTVASGVVTVGDPDAIFECWAQEDGNWKGRVRTGVLPSGEEGSLYIAPVATNSDGTEYAFFPGSGPAPIFRGDVFTVTPFANAVDRIAELGGLPTSEPDADPCEVRDATGGAARTMNLSEADIRALPEGPDLDELIAATFGLPATELIPPGDQYVGYGLRIEPAMKVMRVVWEKHRPAHGVVTTLEGWRLEYDGEGWSCGFVWDQTLDCGHASMIGGATAETAALAICRFALLTKCR